MKLDDWIRCPECNSPTADVEVYSDATAECECQNCNLKEEYELEPGVHGPG